MSFDDLISGINDSCLDCFAEKALFIARFSNPGAPAATIRGIKFGSIEPDENDYGDGSASARFDVQESAFEIKPTKGDQIVFEATHTYDIGRIEADAGILQLFLKYREKYAVEG